MGTGGVIVVSDKQARLKPCLRCGYSLLRIAGARNCPECGLAVRISLAGNSGLEWSNPRWQRVGALALCVLAFGLVCRMLSAVSNWVSYGAFEDYYQLGDLTYRFLEWIDKYAGEADPIFCGVALCVLAKGERRHPDRSRAVRGITLAAGILLIAFGLLNALVRHGFLPFPLLWYFLLRAMRGPWIPLVISILVCTYALHIGRRSSSRFLRRVSQVPLWPTAAGLVVWLLNLNRLFEPLSSLLLDIAFPLTMIVMLVVAVRVLLSGAREAELNWVTDP
ncbi:MAG TPA: hypothetical protein VIM11_14035 [Tepidisphaeraceae bacterium]|jgi:hypothetical protein